MTLPLVCNMEQIDAFVEDKFTIKVWFIYNFKVWHHIQTLRGQNQQVHKTNFKMIGALYKRFKHDCVCLKEKSTITGTRVIQTHLPFYI